MLVLGQTARENKDRNFLVNKLKGLKSKFLLLPWKCNCSMKIAINCFLFNKVICGSCITIYFVLPVSVIEHPWGKKCWGWLMLELWLDVLWDLVAWEEDTLSLLLFPSGLDIIYLIGGGSLLCFIMHLSYLSDLWFNGEVIFVNHIPSHETNNQGFLSLCHGFCMSHTCTIIYCISAFCIEYNKTWKCRTLKRKDLVWNYMLTKRLEGKKGMH